MNTSRRPTLSAPLFHLIALALITLLSACGESSSTPNGATRGGASPNGGPQVIDITLQESVIAAATAAGKTAGDLASVDQIKDGRYLLTRLRETLSQVLYTHTLKTSGRLSLENDTVESKTLSVTASGIAESRSAAQAVNTVVLTQLRAQNGVLTTRGVKYQFYIHPSAAASTAARWTVLGSQFDGEFNPFSVFASANEKQSGAITFYASGSVAGFVRFTRATQVLTLTLHQRLADGITIERTELRFRLEGAQTVSTSPAPAKPPKPAAATPPSAEALKNIPPKFAGPQYAACVPLSESQRKIAFVATALAYTPTTLSGVAPAQLSYKDLFRAKPAARGTTLSHGTPLDKLDSADADLVIYAETDALSDQRYQGLAAARGYLTITDKKWAEIQMLGGQSLAQACISSVRVELTHRPTDPYLFDAEKLRATARSIVSGTITLQLQNSKAIRLSF